MLLHSCVVAMISVNSEYQYSSHLTTRMLLAKHMAVVVLDERLHFQLDIHVLLYTNGMF